MKNPEKKIRRRYSDNNHIPDISETASANECTGLMPTPPQGEWEFESYGQLFARDIHSDKD